MINETYKAMLGGKSIIRELSEYATKRGEKIGYDNVFDYSLGNPSVPCAEDYTKAIIDMHETMNPMELHGYSPVYHHSLRCAKRSQKPEPALWHAVRHGTYLYDVVVQQAHWRMPCVRLPNRATRC